MQGLMFDKDESKTTPTFVRLLAKIPPSFLELAYEDGKNT